MIMIEQLKELPFAERFQLAVDLWDSVEDDSSNAISLNAEQIRELDYRLDLLEAKPKEGVLWSTVRDRILATL